jgi:multidrug efflux pump subunit AcrB
MSTARTNTMTEPAKTERLGLSGRIAARFQATEITPLLALLGLLLGLFAVLVTPREEEPQIDVTFADVFIPFPGASATEIEHLVAGPAEQVFSEIKGVEHVYSVSRPGLAVVTVQYKVGEDNTEAVVRLFSKVMSNQDWLPPNLGVGTPIVKPMGIDDVPILTATLWSEDDAVGAYELGQVAHALEQEIKRVPGTRDVYTLGAPAQLVRVQLQPEQLAGYGLDLDGLRRALQAGNRIADNLSVTADNQEILVQAGTFLTSVEAIGELVVGVHEGRPVYLRDVATLERGPETTRNLCAHGRWSWRTVGRHRRLDPSGRDHRRGQAGGRQCRRGGERCDRAFRAAQGVVHPRWRRSHHHPRLWRHG